MSFSDPASSFEDILENIARIERFVSGIDEAAFYRDEKTHFSVQYALLAISEAARRLGEKAEERCPGLPWKNIRGIGNRLRHGYDSIDPVTIWTTVQQDLPPLQMAVTMALNRIEDEGPQP